jgi:hypothetical protein
MSTCGSLLEDLGSTPTTRPPLLPAKLRGVALGDAAELRLYFEVNLPSPKLSVLLPPVPEISDALGSFDLISL